MSKISFEFTKFTKKHPPKNIALLLLDYSGRLWHGHYLGQGRRTYNVRIRTINCASCCVDGEAAVGLSGLCSWAVVPDYLDPLKDHENLSK